MVLETIGLLRDDPAAPSVSAGAVGRPVPASPAGGVRRVVRVDDRRGGTAIMTRPRKSGPTYRIGAAMAVVVMVVAWLGLSAGAGKAATPTPPPPGTTLQAVRAHGQVRCGVSNGLAGFSERDAAGVWVGFDVDFCRAVAAAVLGDATKVAFVPTSVQQGLATLARGEIDLLSRNVTITMKRVTELGLLPVGVTFFDGQGFLVRRAGNLRTLHELAGRSICFQSGTTAEDNLKEAFAARQISYVPVSRSGLKDMIRVFLEGGCDAVSGDSSSLASIRVTALPEPDRYVILRQRISKEPFGPLVRRGDDGWLEIARWTLMAMIEAEEVGVSRATVEALHTSDNPRVRHLLGITPGLGQALGLDDRWAWRVVSQVGNYGDSFEANLGQASPLKLDRGLNELWTRGGLLFAFPLR
jgi:general L-amino acid transport system substrate-binding protein